MGNLSTQGGIPPAPANFRAGVREGAISARRQVNWRILAADCEGDVVRFKVPVWGTTPLVEPCLPHGLVGSLVRAEEETGCERDLARTCPDAPAVTAWVLGYSGCAGVFSSGAQVGSAGKLGLPRLHSSSQLSCTAVSRMNERDAQVPGPGMRVLFYRT